MTNREALKYWEDIYKEHKLNAKNLFTDQQKSDHAKKSEALMSAIKNIRENINKELIEELSKEIDILSEYLDNETETVVLTNSEVIDIIDKLNLCITLVKKSAKEDKNKDVVFLKEEYGRLVDADHMLNRFKNYYEINRQYDVGPGIAQACEMIQGEPTVVESNKQ